jgi:hypothetical protein
MRNVCAADLAREAGEPWSGVPPEVSTELLMAYLICSLNRHAWDDPWCSETLTSAVPSRFLQPAMDDSTEELYHHVYAAFMDVAGYQQISTVDLNRFHDLAVPPNKKLPYVGTMNGKAYSWFFPVDGETVWKSCFLRSERLRQDVLAGIGLYGSSVAPSRPPRFMDLPRTTGRRGGPAADGAAEEDALRQLQELDVLIGYVLRHVARDRESGGLRRDDRKVFHERYMDVLRHYGSRYGALRARSASTTDRGESPKEG